MRRIHDALHAIAEALGVAGIRNRAFQVAEGVRTVDRLDAGGAAFDEKPRAHISELGAVAASLGAEVGDHVLARDEERADPAARARDLERAHEARGRLDIRHQLDPRRRGRLEALHLLGRRDLGHHQHIGPLDAGQVVNTARFQRIDAHAGDGAAFAPACEGGGG